MAVTRTTPFALGKALDRLERDLGLSSDEIAAALGVPLSLLERWRTGEAHPEGEAERRLAELRDLHRHLRETFAKPKIIPAYLRSPSRYLGGMAPADVLRAGRLDRVEAALEALDSGAFV